MTKSLLKKFVFLVLITGLAALTFAAQIVLLNGRVLEGPIVSYSAASVTIKDAILGEITTPRTDIFRIDPPLEGNKPAVAAAAYAFPQKVELSRPKNGGLQLGFNLGGGLSNIDGGDFNKVIRDANSFAGDYNDYWGQYNAHDRYTVNWKEMKWLTNFRGEIFLRIGKYLGFGLGAEYMKKSNAGTIAYDLSDSYTDSYSFYYITHPFTDNEMISINQSITVIPLTLNIYGFLPLGAKGELYAFVGPEYDLGTWEETYKDDETSISKDLWYFNDGTPWPPHYYDRYVTEYNLQGKATCNTLGFHFGAGFNFKLSSAISLYAEAFYRIAKFDNWQGNASFTMTGTEDWGWVNDPNGPGPNTHTSSDSDSWTGKLWYYEDYISYLRSKYYGHYDLFKAGDEPVNDNFTKNVRPAEFNITGFSLRIGVKIGFDLR